LAKRQWSRFDSQLGLPEFVLKGIEICVSANVVRDPYPHLDGALSRFSGRNSGGFCVS
jgi:hypothetical protein